MPGHELILPGGPGSHAVTSGNRIVGTLPNAAHPHRRAVRVNPRVTQRLERPAGRNRDLVDAIEAGGLGKRYCRKWALRDCVACAGGTGVSWPVPRARGTCVACWFKGRRGVRDQARLEMRRCLRKALPRVVRASRD